MHNSNRTQSSTTTNRPNANRPPRYNRNAAHNASGQHHNISGPGVHHAPTSQQQTALHDQWNMANGWGTWNTQQHYPHPGMYAGGDYRMLPTIVPVSQHMGPYGDFAYAGPAPGHHQVAPMGPPGHHAYFSGHQQPHPQYIETAYHGVPPMHPMNGCVSNMPHPYVMTTDFHGPGGISPTVSTDESQQSQASPSDSMVGQGIGSSGSCGVDAVDMSSGHTDTSDDDDDESHNVSSEGWDAVVMGTFSHYNLSGSEEAAKISKLMTDICQPGASSCIICICTIKRQQAVWNCVQCSCMYHLQCIQTWARDSIAKNRLNSELNNSSYNSNRNATEAEVNWDCPKCRHQYSSREVPGVYKCFCGKTQDPDFNPWHVPHSCGNACEKPLKGQCKHRCTLLCHPGACPPCAQMVSVKCQCGSGPAKPRRCSNPVWTCSSVCGKTINCGKHKCQSLCHEGPCPPCEHMEIQKCECGLQESQSLCTGKRWNCDTVCGKPLSCGLHMCEKRCHAGDCGDCIIASSPRTCPCGAVTYPGSKDGKCAEFESGPPAVCENICGKVLSCGEHNCEQLCHIGDCGSCKQQVLKRCACGKRTKSTLCTTPFTCDVKCTRMRDCGRHPCKKKCCTGDCVRCENKCGQTLSCKNHKCQQDCHAGPCYPCQQVKTIKCPCQVTSMEVPCGREKGQKGPTCPRNCNRVPACHHKTSAPHKCHSGHCPECKQVCAKSLEKCGHLCLAVCHSAVWTKYQPKKLLSGDVQPRFIQQDHPCPSCGTQVEISCLGQHETISIQCAKAKQYSCGQPCGRSLSCGNHVCERTCHVVQGAQDDCTAGHDCDVCERGCDLARPLGCEHGCPQPCHLPPCPPCGIKTGRKCMCGHLTLMIACHQWTEASEEEKQELLNGNHPCPHQMDCGHACPLACHAPGRCLPADECTKRAVIRCACGRIRQETTCHLAQRADKLPCDPVCEQRMEKKRLKKGKSSTNETGDDGNSEEGSPTHQAKKLPCISNITSPVNASPKAQPTPPAVRPRNETTTVITASKPLKKPRGLMASSRASHGAWYSRSYFIPLLLAFFAIFMGLYISLTAELS